MDTLMGETAKANWKCKDIINTFDAHCNPSVNEIVERYRFFSREQGLSETIDCYVTDLKVLAKTCDFGTFRDSLIRDRIVCGSNNASTRELLLHEKNMTLDACIQLWQGTTNSQRIKWTVHFVANHMKSKQKCPAYGRKCKKCGKENHFAGKCKASQQPREKEQRKKQVHNVAEHESDEFEEILCVTAEEIDSEFSRL